MTIPSSTRRAGPFDGNDTATEFPFEFQIFTKADLQVTLTNPQGVESILLLDSDYSVAISADPQAPGGSVTYPISGTPLPTDWRLTLTGRLSYSQTTDIQNLGGFYPGVIETALDRLAVQTQQLAERADRAVQVPVSSDTTPEQLIDQLVQATADSQTAASAAGASAGAAATSESNAANSATSALASKNAAATSETNAATSAAQALASKNAAANSEDNAAGSASTAVAAASSASAFKDAAALSASASATSATSAATSADLAEAAVDQISGNGIWVGSAVWWSGARAAIPAGLIPADGQEVPHATFPDLHTAINAGVFQSVSESGWQSNPLNRGKFVIESSAGKMRVPDLNGKSIGSIGALYATGDGARSPGASGNALQDALQNITGEAGGSIIGSGSWAANSALYGKSLGTRPSFLSTADHYSLAIDISRNVRTDVYTRPNSVSGVWCIQAFGAVVNPGSVDAAQLASDMAALNAAFQTLAGEIDFTIIYPNGGSAASPANVSVNSRYVEPNPFPGHHVVCQAEVYVGGKWGSTGFLSSASEATYGAQATYFDGSIVVQTGFTGISASSFQTGDPRGAIGNITTPTPCRVLVWKIKGAI